MVRDYLQERRKLKELKKERKKSEVGVSTRDYIGLNEVKNIIKEKGMDNNTFKFVKSKLKSIEEKTKQKNMLLKFSGGVANKPELGDEVCDLMINSIKAKLSLIKEMDKNLDDSSIEEDEDNALVPLLKGVLKLIKTNVIEKNLIETMNTKIGRIFQKVNNIILNGVEPKTLNIAMKEQERIDLKKSSIISVVGYLLNNLTGANGPLSLNNLVNIFTFDTGVISLYEFYNKYIHFEFNLTDKDNSSLGNFDVA